MSIVLGGIIGLCVADALGVPVEFKDRSLLDKEPVTEMRGFGTYDQPPGTWSDDSSMALCLAESLSRGLDYTDIMNNLQDWINDARFTATGEVFDVGSTTMKALTRYNAGASVFSCGGEGDHDNGNGSLVRSLPLVFFLNTRYEEICDSDEAMEIVHKVSSLTHAHKRSQLACGIFISVAVRLLAGMSARDAVLIGTQRASAYYRGKPDFVAELSHFERIFDLAFAELPRDQIRSSGYVVDTLEAAVWCLLNTNNYRDCVLKAVNLGSDTDTVGAVAGGLAGIRYRYESIPAEWLEELAEREYVEKICEKLEEGIRGY